MSDVFQEVYDEAQRKTHGYAWVLVVILGVCVGAALVCCCVHLCRTSRKNTEQSTYKRLSKAKTVALLLRRRHSE